MAWTTSVKRAIYPLYIFPRITSGSKRRWQDRFAYHRQLTSRMELTGRYRAFSNQEEDDLIVQLLAALDLRTGYFVDLGSNDCINSNCANLVFNFGWRGLFVDADERLLALGERSYRFFRREKGLLFRHCFLRGDNVEQCLQPVLQGQEVDFMNIDIDGDDYGIWAGLRTIRPKLVLIETKIEFGAADLVIAPGDVYAQDLGASLPAMTRLSEEKGYVLVATNRAGFNAFYLRRDLWENSRLQQLDVQTVLSKPEVKGSFYPENRLTELQKGVNALNRVDQTERNG